MALPPGLLCLFLNGRGEWKNLDLRLEYLCSNADSATSQVLDLE